VGTGIGCACGSGGGRREGCTIVMVEKKAGLYESELPHNWFVQPRAYNTFAIDGKEHGHIEIF
jgi:hypothetical protein